VRCGWGDVCELNILGLKGRVETPRERVQKKNRCTDERGDGTGERVGLLNQVTGGPFPEGAEEFDLF